MCEEKTLSQYWQDTFGTSFDLWGYIMDDHDPPFVLPFEEAGLTVNPVDLDITTTAFFGKRIFDQSLSGLDHGRLCVWVYNHLKDRLYRYAADFSAEYNPAENYISHEEDELKETPSGTDTTTHSYTNYKETQKYGHQVTTSSDSALFGFDTTSDDGVKSDRSGASTTFDQAEGQTGDERSITGTMTDSWQHGAKTDTKRTIDRHGNIGVKTAGEMLEGDLRFYELHNLIELIARDTAELLTIPAYE